MAQGGENKRKARRGARERAPQLCFLPFFLPRKTIHEVDPLARGLVADPLAWSLPASSFCAPSGPAAAVVVLHPAKPEASPRRTRRVGPAKGGYLTGPPILPRRPARGRIKQLLLFLLAAPKALAASRPARGRRVPAWAAGQGARRALPSGVGGLVRTGAPVAMRRRSRAPHSCALAAIPAAGGRPANDPSPGGEADASADTAVSWRARCPAGWDPPTR